MAYTVSDADVAKALGAYDCRSERYDRLRTSARRLWGGDSCFVVQCLSCGMHYADPFVAGDQTFYQLAYDSGEYPAWKWEHEQTRNALVRLIRGHALRGGDFALLEVGAGDGTFLAGISPQLTRRESVLGTEYATAGIAGIRRRGFAASQGSLFELEARGLQGRYEVICLFQVLEHLASIDDFLASLGRLAAADAHIFLSVPAAGQREIADSMGIHLDVPPIHISRWTRSGLVALATRHGWFLAADATEPEDLPAKVRRVARGRVDGSRLGSWTNAIRNPVLRRSLKAAAAALLLAAQWRGLLRLRAPSCGLSYWAHLQRRPPNGVSEGSVAGEGTLADE